MCICILYSKHKTKTYPYVLPSGGSRTNAPRFTPHNLAKTAKPRSSISPMVCSLMMVRSMVHTGELIINILISCCRRVAAAV